MAHALPWIVLAAIVGLGWLFTAIGDVWRCLWLHSPDWVRSFEGGKNRFYCPHCKSKWSER